MHERLVLSPQGNLYLRAIPGSDETTASSHGDPLKRLRAAFDISPAKGLLELARFPIEAGFPPEFGFWKQWACRFFQGLCHLDQQQRVEFVEKRSASERLNLPPDDLQLAVVIAEAPPMPGLEYLSTGVLKSLWQSLAHVVKERAADQPDGLVELLRSIEPRWQLLGRVTFHLAENRKDPDRPFAFLATYTHGISAKSGMKHLPLAEALRQYAGQQNKDKLVELLTPVRMAAERVPIIKSWLESRALFHPQALEINRAYEFLRSVAVLEECGLAVRVPDWWRGRRHARPAVQVRLGSKEPTGLGAGSLLDFSVELALDGQPLTDDEQQALLQAHDGLMLLRGKWVEVDRHRLEQALTHWQQLKQEHAQGVDFLRGMRLLAGTAIDGDDQELTTHRDWSQITAGTWLQELLAAARSPAGALECQPGRDLKAALRPYQVRGVRWLWFMTKLGLGACLADDMGLGKTIQVIDLMVHRRGTMPGTNKGVAPALPSLFVVPASLIGNWKQEFARFAPQLKLLYWHRSEMDAATIQHMASQPPSALRDVDAVVTSYTMVRTAEWLSQRDWDLIVLDEAQAIKNPSSAQTRAVKKLKARCRVILTGTPVENQLGDLWSLFDFFAPGLLGTSKQFKEFIKRIGKQDEAQAYGSLRRLVQPYILRRMKTDPHIAPDLPDKTEMRVECGLSKRQAALYQQAVNELSAQLKSINDARQGDGIRRRGIVLSTMVKLKQICNHPSQLAEDAPFRPDDSGKFLQLAEIAAAIGQRQEKALIFTQFQSMCAPLAEFLATVFGSPGLVLHGGTAVRKRKELVRRFQEVETIPFFVISLKAGGTGLNLTAASHVIHFDRWWNPAVENQATDRAFRIVQKRNVLVHKFVCRGTLEERIDEMLRTKQTLTDAILGPSQEGERLLTEMSDRELLEFVALDVNSCQVSPVT